MLSLTMFELDFTNENGDMVWSNDLNGDWKSKKNDDWF